MDLKTFLGKRIRVVVDTHIATMPTRIFTGEIISIDEESFNFKDKFGKTILIMNKDIMRVEEVGEENGDNR